MTFPLTILPGEDGTITVRFAPGATGVRTGGLVVNSNAAGSPHLIPLSGVGLAAPPPPPPPLGEITWLRTSGRLLLDENDDEVMLQSINWYGFESILVPMGLWGRAYKTITVSGTVHEGILDQIKRLGFNSIRMPFCQDITWSGVTPNTTFSGFGSTYIHPDLNPDLFTTTPTPGVSPQPTKTSLQILDAIVAHANTLGLRIVLDMHCLAKDDDNVLGTGGKWYTTAARTDTGQSAGVTRELRSEEQALVAWEALATRYADDPTICGADIINEPHACTWGDGNLATDVRAYYQRAAARIHAINPNWLIICEGITGNVDHTPIGADGSGGEYTWGTIWSGKLDQARTLPVVTSTPNRVVYSPHEYGSQYSGSTSIAHQWFEQPDYPLNMPEVWRRQWGYLAEENIAPVWIGEIGCEFTVGVSSYTEEHLALDTAWLEKFAGYSADHRVGFAWWAINPGGYPSGLLALESGGVWGQAPEYKMDQIEPLFGGLPSPTPSLYLTTSGTQILDYAGNPFRLKSIAWYGFNSTAYAPHGLWSGGLNWEYCLETMLSLGFNSVRLPISWDFCANLDTLTPGDGIIGADVNPDLVGDTGHEIFQKVLDKCAALGLRVVIDMHVHSAATTGLIDGDPLSGGTLQQWIDRWAVIANEYGGHPAVVGFELYNEPHTLTWAAWATMFEACANQLHEIAPHLLMIAQGVGSADAPSEPWLWGQNLTGARTRPIVLAQPNRLVYAPHEYGQTMYDYLAYNFPWLLTETQAVPGYPNNLFAFMRDAWGFILSNRMAPVWISEFGGAFGGYGDTATFDAVTWPTYAAELQWLDVLQRFLDGEYFGDGINHRLPGELGGGFAYWCFNGGGDQPFGMMTETWTVNTPKRATLNALLGPYVAPAPSEHPLPVPGWFMQMPPGLSGTYIAEARTVEGDSVDGYKIAISGTLTAPGYILATMTQISAVQGDEVTFSFPAEFDVDSAAISAIFVQVTETSAANAWLTAGGTNWYAGRNTLGARTHVRTLTNAGAAHAKGEFYTNTIPSGTAVTWEFWIGATSLAIDVPPVESPTPPAGWFVDFPAGLDVLYLEEERTVSGLPVVGTKITVSGTSSATGQILLTIAEIDALVGDDVDLSFPAKFDVDSAAITEIFAQITETSAANAWLAADGTDWYSGRMTMGARTHSRTLTNGAAAHAKAEIYTNSILSGTTVALTMWVGATTLTAT